MAAIAHGIDISKHNGKLNWEAIKGKADFVILRLGYGQDIKSQDDEYFEYNAAECARLDIPYGVYLYSYANSEEKAKSEAAHALRLLEGKAFSYPVYYDLEDENTTGKLSNEEIANIAKIFCDTLEDAGYYVGIYANKYWFTTRLTSSVFDSWTKWVAQYASDLTYAGKVGMWQYTSSGALDGLSGTFDMNHLYIDYPSIIVPKGFNNNLSAEIQQGDVNGDGKITVADARLALRAAVKISTLSNEELKRADINGDGKVSLSDALKILRMALKI